MKIYEFNPHKLPKDVLEAVGLYIIASAHTEGVVEMAIASLLQVDDRLGLAVTTHMNGPLRISALRSLGNLRFSGEILADFNTHVEALQNVNAKRNAIAHRSWCQDPENGKLYTLRQAARTKLELELVPMSVDEIKREAVNIHQVGLKFLSFLNRIGIRAAPDSKNLQPS